MLKKPENQTKWDSLRETSFLQTRTNFSSNSFKTIIRLPPNNSQLSKGNSTLTILWLLVLRTDLWPPENIRQVLRQGFLRVVNHQSITLHLWSRWMLNLEASLLRRTSLWLWISLWLRTSWTSLLTITHTELSITVKCLVSSSITSTH